MPDFGSGYRAVEVALNLPLGPFFFSISSLDTSSCNRLAWQTVLALWYSSSLPSFFSASIRPGFTYDVLL